MLKTEGSQTVSDDNERSDTIPTALHEESRQSEGNETGASSSKATEKTGNTMSTSLMDAPTQGLFLSDELEYELLRIFKLLSDETRLRILLYLGREQELHVTALCTRLGQSQPAVSHHLALLREADLIEARRDGKHNFYSLKRGHFHSVIERLFVSIADPDKAEIRFDEFVLLYGNDDDGV